MDRAIVSMLRIWLISISPAIGSPGGRTTLVGNGRIWDVIGHTTTKPVLRLKAVGEITSAGLRPACSRPLVGSKSVQIRSPVPGTYGGGVNLRSARGQHPAPSHRRRHRLHAIPRACCLGTALRA